MNSRSCQTLARGRDQFRLPDTPTAVFLKIPDSNSCKRVPNRPLRPRYDPAEADLELFCNSWSAGFLG